MYDGVVAARQELAVTQPDPRTSPPAEDVHRSAAWVEAIPFAPDERTRGFIYQVETVRLREVTVR